MGEHINRPGHHRVKYDASRCLMLADELDALAKWLVEGLPLRNAAAALRSAVDEAERLREKLAPEAVEVELATFDYINELVVELGISYIGKSLPNYQGDTYLRFRIVDVDKVECRDIQDIGVQALRLLHSCYDERVRSLIEPCVGVIIE